MNGLNYIYIKFRETEAAGNDVTSSEFTAHYACKNEEINLKSTFTNGFNFLIINSLKESWGYAGLTWLDCKAVAPSVSHTMPRRVFRPKLHISGLKYTVERHKWKFRESSNECSVIFGVD